MNLIINNPFRILGLPITATEREIAKRVSDLITYAEFGKSPSYKSDFLFLSNFNRTPQLIEEASKKIDEDWERQERTCEKIEEESNR